MRYVVAVDTEKNIKLNLEGAVKLSLIRVEHCGTCARADAGTCNYVKGSEGATSEIGDGFWCENYLEQ